MTDHPALALATIGLALTLGAAASYVATRGERVKLAPSPGYRWRQHSVCMNRRRFFRELAIAGGLSLIVVIVMMALASAAEAKGWHWFLHHIRPTGACSSGHEIIGSIYWHGTRTATGERFRPHGITAAHRTLPFGTIVNVRNPQNGRAVAVRINDRGPYIAGVHAAGAIDLSLGAATALGMRKSQFVCVEW